MYVPAHFQASEEQLRMLLSQPAAVDLITEGPGGLVATLLPVLWDEAAGSLLGHVARNNPHWKAAAHGGESLAIVRGPDAYVSPSWYPSKAEHGRVVPTWNYLTAHVYGRLIVHEDPKWLRDLVTKLTDRHEADQADPWSVSDAPATFIDGQLRAIVGLELQISRIEAKAKLSQNRPPADRAAVVTMLSAGSADQQQVARAMPGAESQG